MNPPLRARKKNKMKRQSFNLILSDKLTSRVQRHIDGIEIRSLDHAVEISLKNWVELREDMEAMNKQIDADVSEGTPLKN